MHLHSRRPSLKAGARLYELLYKLSCEGRLACRSIPWGPPCLPQAVRSAAWQDTTGVASTRVITMMPAFRMLSIEMHRMGDHLNNGHREPPAYSHSPGSPAASTTRTVRRPLIRWHRKSIHHGVLAAVFVSSVCGQRTFRPTSSAGRFPPPVAITINCAPRFVYVIGDPEAFAGSGISAISVPSFLLNT